MDNHDSTSSAQSAGSHGEPERKSISDRKLAANRLNAGRSTGPKTPEGKRKSCRNSYKVGIFTREMFRRTKEDLKEWEEYKDVVTRIYSHYRPHGVMEELLVDKLVTESIRFARILSYERQTLNRKDALWGDSLTKILRYQTAINRQLTKAIEQLEEVQAERMAQSDASESPDDPEDEGVTDEPDSIPEGLVPESDGGLNPAASRGGTDAGTMEVGDEAVAAHSSATAPDEASCEQEEISNSYTHLNQIYKTNPPSFSAGGGNGGTVHRKPRQMHTFAEVIDRAAGLTTPQEPNNCPVPTLGIGKESQDAISQGPSEEDILNSL